MKVRIAAATLTLVFFGAACSETEQLQSGTLAETAEENAIGAPARPIVEPAETTLGSETVDPAGDENTGTSRASEQAVDTAVETAGETAEDAAENADNDAGGDAAGAAEESSGSATEIDGGTETETNVETDGPGEQDGVDLQTVRHLSLTVSEPGDSGDHVLALQERLANLGFAPGTPDGSYGHRTAKAIVAFQSLLGLNETGIADARTVAALTAYRYDGLLLAAGDEGEAVEALQEQLNDGPFDPGPIDGVYGTGTRQAVWALEKMAGIPVDGHWGPLDEDAWEKLLAGRIGKPTKSHDLRWVEVDLSLQIMKVYDPDSETPVLISHASSGSGVPWSNEEHSGSSITPVGDFHIDRRISGWRESSLNIGRLYNPLYFNGGIAFHGATSVPLYPASHGCVRLPMHVADYLPGELPNGTPVHVLR